MLMLLTACGPNYQAHVGELRLALDHGSLERAIAAANAALGVDHENALPAENGPLTPLLLLERATLLHAAGQYELSARDFQLADASLELLDLGNSTAQDLAEYLFSDARANYRTPPYEKLMLNTLNQLNYLAMGDLEGARVEARRIGVLQRHFSTDDSRATIALGAYLAGFTFEKSGRPEDAILWYRTALEAGASRDSVGPAIARLAPYARQNDALVQDLAAHYPHAALDRDEAEVLVVFEAGRAPWWIDQRLPIGAAIALVGADLSHDQRATADRLILEGLFKWVNFPEMVVTDTHPVRASAMLRIGNTAVTAEPLLDLEHNALAYYDSIKGQLVLAALTRMLTRYAASQITEAAVSRGQGGDAATAGLILGKLVEGAMVIADTPDTRSWNTVPRQYSIARLRLPAGKHDLALRSASGADHSQTVTLRPGGFKVLVVHDF